MSPNISVIIPTFNRFKFLLNAIESVRNQTYKDFEIIVVNDGSSDLNYYNHPWTSDITIIHLPENTRQMFKFASANYVRNIGIQNSSGKYIAFLDDDDIWLPHKLEYQIKAIETTGCSMCCTEAYIGRGVFNPNKKYSNYISQKSFENVKSIFNKQGSHLIDNGYPAIWNKDLLKFHNVCITSSVIVDKNILTTNNCITNQKMGHEDYNIWLKVLEHTDCAFVDVPCLYYDNNHGYGQKWH